MWLGTEGTSGEIGGRGRGEIEGEGGGRGRKGLAGRLADREPGVAGNGRN